MADAAPGDRPLGTAILFLLTRGAASHRRRVNATDIWHFHAGAPPVLRLSATDHGPATRHPLGAGQSPHIIVPTEHWHAAQGTGGWSLVCCTDPDAQTATR